MNSWTDPIVFPAPENEPDRLTGRAIGVVGEDGHFNGAPRRVGRFDEGVADGVGCRWGTSPKIHNSSYNLS